MEIVKFRSDGQQVEAALVVPENKPNNPAGVILIHGCGSSRRGYVEIAQRLAQAGLVGLAVDMRGHGKSEGNLSELRLDDLVNDGLNAYDFLKHRGIVDRVGMCGASLGGLISAMVSTEREVDSLVLRAPATYSPQLRQMDFKSILASQNRLFFDMTDLELEGSTGAVAISQFIGDLLVIASGEDEIIPRQIPEMYIAKATRARRREMFIIDGAPHALAESIHRGIFIDAVDRWLRPSPALAA